MTTILLTQNPAKSDLDAAYVPRRLRDGKRVEWGWTVHSQNLIQKGDEVFWLRLGPSGRGIFGRGEITRAPYQAPHWDPARRGQMAYYVRVRVLEMVDPDTSPVLRQEELSKQFPRQYWSPQSSGISVKADVVPGLRRLWSRHYAQAKRLTRAAAAAPPTADPIRFEKSVRKLRSSRLVIEPKGEAKPEQVTVKVRRIVRDPRVHAFVMQEAKGKCECCRRKAPFVSDDGNPFLEVHHLKQLAQGGPDTVANAVAVCPNCHRELHHGRGRKKLVARLRKQIEQRSHTLR